MPRLQSPAAHLAVYVLARCVICLFQTLSERLGAILVEALAWAAFTFDKRHTQVARENLRQAFPGEFGEAELDKLVLATYRHFFTLMLEMSRLPRKMHRHNVGYYLALGRRTEEMVALLRSNRPLLLVTGHFGNWELAGYGLGIHGLKTHAVARPLDNPYLETWLRNFRQRVGQSVLSKKDVLGIANTLATGGKVAVLADQNAGASGIAVQFFGKEASTHKGIAVLALQHRAPLIVVGVRKIAEPMRYQVVVEDVIYPEDYTGHRADAARRITQRYTNALERIVRTAPEQYFWLHNRWKEARRTAVRRAA